MKHTDEIPALVDFIGQELDGYSAKQLKVLYSRIVSLDELGHDM